MLLGGYGKENKMEDLLIKIINYLIPVILGYCISIIKTYKNKTQVILKDINQLKETQLMDMRSDISNKFYVYSAMEKVEDYLVMSFREKCERYFELGGDSWVHPMYDQSFKWKIKATQYLN